MLGIINVRLFKGLARVINLPLSIYNYFYLQLLIRGNINYL
jgi:hypothetical protein